GTADVVCEYLVTILPFNKTCIPGLATDSDTSGRAFDAGTGCKSLNGYLVLSPNTFIAKIATEIFGVSKEDRFWIGVDDLLGSGWTNIDDGSQTKYFSWAVGEPVNDTHGSGCVYMSLTGDWYNGNCFNALPFVCEVPMVEITRTSTVSPTTPSPGCDSGWTEINNQCYQLIAKNSSISAAETECRNLKSNIVSIHDHKTSVELGIELLSPALSEAAIGLCSNFYNGTGTPTWFWADFSPFDYEYWGTDEPQVSPGVNDYCATINIDGLWSAHDASKTYQGYICQKPKK
ncbi:hypothetical protein FO519_006630, partial [Halicephalobus sp. NKZ332]